MQLYEENHYLLFLVDSPFIFSGWPCFAWQAPVSVALSSYFHVAKVIIIFYTDYTVCFSYFFICNSIVECNKCYNYVKHSV